MLVLEAKASDEHGVTKHAKLTGAVTDLHSLIFGPKRKLKQKRKAGER